MKIPLSLSRKPAHEVPGLPGRGSGMDSGAVSAGIPDDFRHGVLVVGGRC